VVDLTPKITTEDIRLALNATYSGSSNSYFFWGQEISSGSILSQINLSNYFLFGILGDTVMNSTDDITSYHVRTCELDYSAMRVLVLLSGDVISDGFNFSAGISVQQPLLLATYRNLISEFKESAQMHLRAIQPLYVSAESDTTVYRDTAPSYF
jgi:hypothetical protein